MEEKIILKMELPRTSGSHPEEVTLGSNDCSRRYGSIRKERLVAFEG